MTVRPGDTCLAMGISDLPILAPGHFMSVMESACVAALVELLENGETTIVDKFDISLIDSVGIGGANNFPLESCKREKTFYMILRESYSPRLSIPSHRIFLPWL